MAYSKGAYSRDGLFEGRLFEGMAYSRDGLFEGRLFEGMAYSKGAYFKVWHFPQMLAEKQGNNCVNQLNRKITKWLFRKRNFIVNKTMFFIIIT